MLGRCCWMDKQNRLCRRLHLYRKPGCHRANSSLPAERGRWSRCSARIDAQSSCMSLQSTPIPRMDSSIPAALTHTFFTCLHRWHADHLRTEHVWRVAHSQLSAASSKDATSTVYSMTLSTAKQTCAPKHVLSGSRKTPRAVRCGSVPTAVATRTSRLARRPSPICRQRQQRSTSCSTDTLCRALVCSPRSQTVNPNS